MPGRHRGSLTDPDPWRGFRTVLEKVCLLQATDRGFTAAFVASFPDMHSEVRERTWHWFAANNGLAGVPAEMAVAASQRLVAYLLEAFRAGTDALPPPVPLSLDLVLR